LVSFLVLFAAAAQAQAPPAMDGVVAQVVQATCARPIVLLGELPSHGEAQAFRIKAAVVERLIDQCGFDAVLFEAPIYDFIGFQAGGASATPAQLDNAIGRFWLSRDLADFRKRLFERATHGAVRVGGLDDQVSVTSEYARAALPARFAGECATTVTRNLRWTYDDAHPFDDAEKSRLRQCAHAARDASGRGDAASQMMLDNFASYVDRQVGAAGARTRDETMAGNLAWYRAQLPADAKIVVWTASVHAARTRGTLKFEPLGALLAEREADDVAAIGFTAFGGLSSMAGRPAQALAEAPPASLEARATSDGKPVRFINASGLRKLGITQSRLLGAFSAAAWSEYFDGVVVIRSETAPVFDRRP
jgi:erythromycin esterase-like protein